MTSEQFEAFLDEATHTVHELWKKAGGSELNIDGLEQLNEDIRNGFASVQFYEALLATQKPKPNA